MCSLQRGWQAADQASDKGVYLAVSVCDKHNSREHSLIIGLFLQAIPLKSEVEAPTRNIPITSKSIKQEPPARTVAFLVIQPILIQSYKHERPLV